MCVSNTFVLISLMFLIFKRKRFDNCVDVLWWYDSGVRKTYTTKRFANIIRSVVNLLWVECYIYPRSSEELTMFDHTRIFSFVNTCLQNMYGLGVMHLPIIFHLSMIGNICIRKEIYVLGIILLLNLYFWVPRNYYFITICYRYYNFYLRY